MEAHRNATLAPGAAPSGTVTFLFSDIEGSTQRWDSHPEAMAGALRRHDELLRSAIALHGGHVFKTIGDAFCVAFSMASSGVEAALLAQQTLSRENWNDVGGLRVRMALHTGVADERDADYFGPPLNRVARLLAVGHGGQVLVSGVTAELARDALPCGASLRDLGHHRLRDLAQPEQIFQLVAADLTDSFAALRSVDVVPNNLPSQSSNLVGRADVVADIKDALARSNLVTLAGTGGVGKTRAALQVAVELLDSFPDGVWLIELAPLVDPSLVAAEIAAPLGVVESRERPLLESLVAYLKTRSVLLVLDNCEHVVAEAAAACAAILRAARNVRILTTSREALNLSGEFAYRMPSLSVPPPSAILSAADALRYESVALFVERAQANNATFRMTDETAPIVADICRRLDGIALAIELAAARTSILPVRDLAARLNERFRVLTGGSRTALPRQQTMRALIDWSYNLLTAAERLLLQRVSIFPGDWSLEAAEAVCTSAASDEGPLLDEMDVLGLVASLVEKSLIVPDVDRSRYRLLESTRAYALEKLTESKKRNELAERHARWVGSAVERWYDAYWTTPPRRWLPEVTPELDNVRAALAWALDFADGDVFLAGRIAAGLEGLWYNGGLSGEGRRWIEAVMARIGENVAGEVSGMLWLTLARIGFAKGMVDAAERAIAVFEQYDEAHPRFCASGYQMLAIGLRRMGRLIEAETAVDRALELYRAGGLTGTWPYVMTLDVRAGILRYQGRIDEARELRCEALLLLESIGDEHGAAIARLNLADLESLCGDPRRALQLAEEAALSCRRANEPSAEAIALINIAAYRLLLDEWDAALAPAKLGLDYAQRAGWPLGIAVAVQHLASIAAANGASQRAARLLGYVDAWHAGESFEREPTEQELYRRLMALLREQLAPEALASLLAAGGALEQEQAIAEASAR